MKTFKTNREFPLVDKRGNSLGNHIIFMIVSSLVIDRNMVEPKGFYYYEVQEFSHKDDEGNDVMRTAQKVLENITGFFLWEDVTQIELQLADLPPKSLYAAILQRIEDFAYVKLQIESGQNFGTVPSDWVPVNELEG